MLNEDENQLDQRRKRKEVECAVDLLVATSDVDPQIKVVPCDDPPVAPRETFFEPNDPPLETPPARQLPPPISVPNAERLLSCPPGKFAASDADGVVAYLAGELTLATQLVFLDNIFSIPTGELYRIAGAAAALEPLVLYELPLLEAATSPDWAAFEASIVVLLGVTPAIATAIRQALAAAQSQANSIADAALAARLRCVWRNKLVHAICDPNAELGYSLIFDPATPPVGVEVSSLAAGVLTSSESQADADTKAGREAARGLNCLYCNDAQVATCAEEEGGAFAGSPTITWVTGSNPRVTSVIPLLNLNGAVFRPAYSLPDQRTLKLTSTIAACFLKARTTEEANALARALAVAGLDCFIPSRRRLFSCTDVAVWGNAAASGALGGVLTEEEILNEMATGDVAGPRVNNAGVVDNAFIDSRVSVQTNTPPGMFFGSTSEEAEGLAAAFALATLRCEWGNHALIYACDDKDSNPAVTAEVANHVAATYPAYPDDPPLPGESKTFTRSNKTGKIILSSALGRNLSMLASPRRSHVYSADVAARQFFGTDGQKEVDRVAAAFVLGQLECTYCNPRIPPVCVTFVEIQAAGYAQAPPYTAENVKLPLVVDDTRLAASQSADATAGVPGIHYTSDLAYPAALLPPANYLTDPTADVDAITCGAVEEVLTIADVIGVIPSRDLVTQNQRCRYGNRRMNFACANGSDADELPFITPFTTPAENYLSAASAPPVGNFFTIAENTYEVYATSELAADKVAAQAAADAQARAIGLSQLDCFYESPFLNLYCGAATGPPAYTEITPELYVAAGAVVALPTTDPGKKNGQIVAEASNGSYAVGAVASNRPVILRHGYAKSYVSPQDALSEAFFEGLAQLDCFFDSAAIDMMCGAPSVLLPAVSPQLPPRENTTIIAGDGVKPGNEPPDVSERTYAPESVGSAIHHVIVASKLFRSYESQHDANTVAYMSALDQLDCFYESRAMSANCGATGGSGSYYIVNGDFIVYEGGGGSWSDFSTGYPEALSVARAAARSYTSQAQADAAAFVTLRAQLVCFYVNNNWISDKCPSDSITVSPGFVGAGEFTSLVSQASADAPAQKLAEALVVCEAVDKKVVEYWKYNEKQEDCKCGEGEDEQPAIKCGVVASGVIRAEGASDESAQAAANGAAMELAKALTQCPPWKKPPTTGVHSLVASSGSVTWLETTTCDGESGGGSGEYGSSYSNDY